MAASAKDSSIVMALPLSARFVMLVTSMTSKNGRTISDVVDSNGKGKEGMPRELEVVRKINREALSFSSFKGHLHI